MAIEALRRRPPRSWNSQGVNRGGASETGPQRLALPFANGVLVDINPIIFAEVSTGYETIEALEDAVPPALYLREPLPWEAGFLAGECFLLYRRRGRRRHSPLRGFSIGAHASVGQLALLTRDAVRYRTYFPRVEILAPM